MTRSDKYFGITDAGLRAMVRMWELWDAEYGEYHPQDLDGRVLRGLYSAKMITRYRKNGDHMFYVRFTERGWCFMCGYMAGKAHE